MSGTDDQSRAERARQVARTCVEAAGGGETLSDEEIISTHVELMPELGTELRKLRLVRGAIARAKQVESGSDGWALDARENTPELPTDAFSGYSIVGEIHRGGQGVVYHAIHHATDREVAIKVMREGPFAGTNDLARFEQEVRLLAGLKHANIVTVHDSGRSADHHYFVMNYVEGLPLDEYVAGGWDQSDPDEPARLSVDRTLRLFELICDAVNTAHLRGVIHRDLKPGNVRVTHDGEPQVLDFGLAKREVDGPSSEIGMTRTGQFVGSFPWASPEQVSGHSSGVDVRTDVYALGVMLYQMLTGVFPYPVQGMPHEVVRNILQIEPSPPVRLRRELNDEVSTIVLKCLAKDPARRYQNAGELGRDIRRYLNHEPIEAKRDSGWYVARKLMQRHRVPVAVASAFVLLITGAAAVLAYQTRALLIAQATADDVTDFLEGALSSADPFGADGNPDMSVRELLNEAAARIETELAGQPQAEAVVRRTIGAAYRGIGLYEDSAAHLEAALALCNSLYGDRSAESAKVLHELAELRQFAGHAGQAKRLVRDALSIRASEHGEQSLEVGDSLTLLGAILRDLGRDEEAEAACLDAIEVLEAAGAQNDPLVAQNLNTLSLLLRDRGELEAAREDAERALAIYRDIGQARHPNIIATLNDLGTIRARQGDLADASELYQEAVEVCQEWFGEDHAFTLRTLWNLGALLERYEAHDDARTHFVDVLARQRARLGAGHPDVARSLSKIASLDARAHQFDAAADGFQRALEIELASFGPRHSRVTVTIKHLSDLATEFIDLRRHAKAAPLFDAVAGVQRARDAQGPELAQTLTSLGRALNETGRHGEAESALREALEIRTVVLDPDDPELAMTLNNLGRALKGAAQLDEALTHYNAALAIRRQMPDGQAKDELVGTTLNNIAKIEIERGALERAEPLFREAVERVDAAKGSSHWLSAVIRVAHGACLTELREFEAAETTLLAAHQALVAAKGEQHAYTRATVTRLVALYEAWQRDDQAQLWRARLNASENQPQP